MEQEKIYEIASKDFWFKVTDFLIQNWALIEPSHDGVTVYFLGDATYGVFDELSHESALDAEIALRRNGFSKLSEDTDAQQILPIPSPPFRRRTHSSGIAPYSTGRFWKL